MVYQTNDDNPLIAMRNLLATLGKVVDRILDTIF